MVCHRIATDHHGTIEVSSRAGRGTSFLVRLPLDASQAPQTNGKAAAAHAAPPLISR